MASDGYYYIAGSSGAGVVGSIAGIVLQSPALLYGAGSCAVLTLFFLIFFRDPERAANTEPEEIISPADGRVVAIVEEEEPNFFKTKVKRISIFLSIFDVHVNRIPLSGRVDYFRYHSGSFKAAFKKEASLHNEQTLIGITDGSRKILFKQIAGFVARRIVCTIKEGQNVLCGERCGMIKFGSRVDVIMPMDAEILITKGQKVYGAMTIIGRFKYEE